MPETEVHYEIKVGEDASDDDSDNMSQGGMTQPSPMSRAEKKDIFVSEFDGSMASGMTPMNQRGASNNLPRFGADNS